MKLYCQHTSRGAAPRTPRTRREAGVAGRNTFPATPCRESVFEFGAVKGSCAGRQAARP